MVSFRDGRWYYDEVPYWDPGHDPTGPMHRFAEDHPWLREQGHEALVAAWDEWVEGEMARQRAQWYNNQEEKRREAAKTDEQRKAERLERENARLRQELAERRAKEAEIQRVAQARNENARLRQMLGMDPYN